MSFIQRRGSGHPRQTSRREDLHILRNTRIQPTASSDAIHSLVAPSQEPHRRRLAGRYFGSRCPLLVLTLSPPLTPPFGVVLRTRKLHCSVMKTAQFQRRIQIQSHQ
ncbi:HTH_Tnp_Tc3_2 domain-containing protein [Trichonephila clavipes]|nr:HTH_Tnp_Tc3_2 domain-containing protein [Trichonephila clavipes]